ncbi:hypothetical protein ACFB49_32620 [Sphingomonas sp. DBB INV C78]|uniref:hypothetical protein n=1 Tax=Sphingomonas sp. DBB INV C78 TaxID=3349434 RepID=UPI0036D377CE
MPDRDPEIIDSDLSRTVTRHGITVTVHIYRLKHDPKWTLEVVNEIGTSTVWDDPFETEQAALDAFETALAEEGVETFLDGSDAETLH